MAEKAKEKLSATAKAALRKIRHLALDMDGTIYLGNSLFPFTLAFFERLERLGIGHSFLTNNPTKSIEDYRRKLAAMGISASEEEIYTTPLAAIDYLRSELPQVRRLFMLGTPSMREQFVQAGFEDCADSPDDTPDALLVAFDTTLSYARLCRAAWWASQGLPYLATNPDRVCPTDQKTILVDCGSLQSCLAEATGRRPDKVLGKPDPSMLDGIRRRHQLEPGEIAMVGDRIYTDIAMGRRAGALSVLVLSGETSLETALKVRAEGGDPAKGLYPADLIVRDIEELGELLEESRR